MSQRVIISTNLESEIAEVLAECEHDKIFVLTDETTVVKCWPVVKIISRSRMRRSLPLVLPIRTKTSTRWYTYGSRWARAVHRAIRA